MKITKRQLRQIIREEKQLITEQDKFEAMLLKEEGDLLKLAFGALKEQGPKVAEYVKQWLKANPDILEEFLEEMMEDGSMKDTIKALLPKGEKEGDDDAAPAAPAKEEAVSESKSRIRRIIRKEIMLREGVGGAMPQKGQWFRIKPRGHRDWYTWAQLASVEEALGRTTFWTRSGHNLSLSPGDEYQIFANTYEPNYRDEAGLNTHVW